MKAVSNITIPILLLLLVGSQLFYDNQTANYKLDLKKATLSFSEPLIPSVTALKILSFGNPSVAADVLWLQTIQYFGSGNPYGDYPALGPLLQKITDLDPQFMAPYSLGMIVLPFMKQSDSAVSLGQKAQTHLPENGLLTYYLATVYHLNKKDYRNAALYYQKAATLPDSPTAAKRLAGITLAELSDTLSDRLVAMEFWKTVYEQTTNPDEKERAALWFSHMQLVYALEKANQSYHEKYGNYPAGQGDLVRAGIIPEEQISAINRELEFNRETGRITFDSMLPE